MKNTTLLGLFVILLFVVGFVPFNVHGADISFSRNLYFGMQKDSDVTKLQEFLTDQGLYSGPITGNFFSLTLKAVKQFQINQGISPAAGFFGPVTRIKVNAVLSEEIQASENQAVVETGTTTAPIATPKTTNDVASSLQAQIDLLMKQLQLMQQQAGIQQQTQQVLQQQVANQQQSQQVLQQIQQNAQVIQQSTQTIQQNTTPVATPTPTPTPRQTGSLTLSVLPNYPYASNLIAVGTADFTLAGYYAKPLGENMEIHKISFGVNKVGSSVPTGTLNVKIAGTTVYSTPINTIVNSGIVTIDLSSYLVLSAGENNFISVSVSSASNINEGDSYMVKDFDVISVKRLTTNDSIDPGVSAVNGPTITVKNSKLTITADAATPLSKILIAGQTSVELSKVRFMAENSDMVLHKITFSFDPAPGFSSADFQKNFSKIYIYDGASLLNPGGTTPQDGNVVIDGIDFGAYAGTPHLMTVKADITDQGMITPKSIGRIIVKGTSATDMKVGSNLSVTDITLTSNAASNYMLVTAAAPIVMNSYMGTLSPAGSASEEIARFTILNPGSRDITLSSFTVNIALTPNGNVSSIDTFKLYESDNLANPVAINSTSLSSDSATSGDVTFNSFSPVTIVSAGGSKTYIVKANTESLCRKNSTFTGSCKLTVKMKGSKGYDSSETGTSTANSEEYYWADGVVGYSYTTTGGTYSNLNASDSGEVVGPTLSY